MGQKATYRKSGVLLKQLPLFYQPWWLDALAKEWDVAIAFENDEVKAVFPFQIEQKIGLKLLRNPQLCPYLGPYFLGRRVNEKEQWKTEEKLLEALWKQIPDRDYFFFTTVPGYDHFLPYHQKGLHNSNRLTYLLNLQDSEQSLFSNIQSRLRGYIKKAEGLLTVQVTPTPDLPTFISWQRQAFQKKSAYYPYAQTMLSDLIKRAENHQSSLFQTAFDDSGKPQAMLWTPFDQYTGYHLLAATHPDCKVNGALALLVWNALKILKGKGLKTYDFEGSMDKGIEHFFRKFGGERTAYLQFEQNKSLIWKIKEALFRVRNAHHDYGFTIL